MADYYTRKWVPQESDWSNNGGPDVILWNHVLAQVQRHSASDLTNEVAGFLLGHTLTFPDRTDLVVFIEAAMVAQHVNTSPSHVEFTHDTWTTFHQEREASLGDMGVVGWYHTHPKWGIFLSRNDTFIHESFFKGTHRVALVIDPVQNHIGIFKRVDGQLDPVRYYGFIELSTTRDVELSPGSNVQLAPTPKAEAEPLSGIETKPSPILQPRTLQELVTTLTRYARFEAVAARTARWQEALSEYWRSMAAPRIKLVLASGVGSVDNLRRKLYDKSCIWAANLTAKARRAKPNLRAATSALVVNIATIAVRLKNNMLLILRKRR